MPLSITNAKSNIPIAEARQLIDEAIEKSSCPSSVLALKSQRNTFASISCLPPELLCQIFSFAQILEPDEMSERKENPDGCLLFEWIKMTHVCRYWRNVAISSPTLWTNLPIENFQWVEEMLKRSKETSLIVNANASEEAAFPGMIPGLRLALKHGSRVKKLSMQYVNLAQWFDLEKQLPETIPRLEFLCLTAGPPYVLEDDSDDDWDPIPVSEAVISKTKRLRHLELTNCEINWSMPSSPFHCITHLKLADLPETSRMSGKLFMDALKAMPDLEHLELDEALPMVTSEQVQLASLQYLFVAATKTFIEPFFRCITFPSETAVRLNCYTNSLTDVDFSGVISELSRSLNTPSYKPTRVISDCPTLIRATLRVAPSYEVAIDLCYVALEDFNFDNSDKNLLFSLLFSWPDTGTTDQVIATEVMYDIFDGELPIRCADMFYIPSVAGEVPIDPKILADTVGLVDGVAVLLSGGSNAVTLVEALQLQDESEDYPDLYFTGLHLLSFFGTTFEEPNPQPSGSEDPPGLLTAESLRDCLVQRYELGAEVEQVYLLSTGITVKGTQLLREVVVYVKSDVDVDEYQ